MATERDYKELVERLVQLEQRQAILISKEEDKRVERERLAQELAAAGVNLEDLDGEITRLTGEIQAHYDGMRDRIDRFEEALNAAIAGSKVLEPR